MSDRIFFRGIVLFARHGVHQEEARLGQRFEIDLDCYLDMQTYSHADDYRGAVSYQDVYDLTREVVDGHRLKLIEALAERIAGRLLDGLPALTGVRVEVRKPAAPVPGIFDTVGVEVIRHRKAASP